MAYGIKQYDYIFCYYQVETYIKYLRTSAGSSNDKAPNVQ